MRQSTVTVSRMVLENALKYNGETLLTYRIEYPEFKALHYQMSLQIINGFYWRRALEFQKYCETELFETAVRQYEYDQENGYPVRVFEALSVFKITYDDLCIISLYTDRYEYTGGAHGNTVRESQTWNLQKCGLVRLRRLFPCGPDYRSYILKEVEKQIEANPEIYFENYRELIRENFKDENFYCVPEGIVVYYQQYDIAPYSSGIREFLIPYGKCVLDPVKMCFPI